MCEGGTIHIHCFERNNALKNTDDCKEFVFLDVIFFLSLLGTFVGREEKKAFNEDLFSDYP